MSRSPLIAVPRVDPGLLARARAYGRQEPAQLPRAATPEPAVDGTTAVIRLYDAIDSWGGYWGVSAKEFARAIDSLDDSVTEIELHLNSPGGDVFEGIAISNMLRGHQASVTVVVDGLAASIASVIAMAGDEVVMAPNSELMIHDAWGICIGNAGDMRKLGDLLDHLSDNLAGAYAAKAGGTKADWREAMLEESWYSAEEAVEAGLADRVLESGGSSARAHDLSAFRYAGRAAAPNPAARRPAARATSCPAPTKGSRMPATEGATRVAGAVPAHETEVVARAFDPARVLAGLPEAPRGSELRSVFAWVDPDGDPELAASYALPHHHGVDGPANLRACVAAIAKLNGAAGGAGVPEQDRQAVYDHLAAHVRDAGEEPVALRDLNDDGATAELFAARLARVLAEVAALNDAATEMVSRAGEGRRPLSKRKTDLMAWVGDELERLKALCANPLPDDGPSREEQQRLLLASLARLNPTPGE